MTRYRKPNYSEFRYTFDEISGYDVASVCFKDTTIFGQLSKSPLQDRIMKEFGFQPLESDLNKPYKAHWMVFESKLLLGYVNGILDGKRYFTRDIIPEFPDEELLFHYFEYSGILTLKIFEIITQNNSVFDNFTIDQLRLEFKDGILLDL